MRSFIKTKIWTKERTKNRLKSVRKDSWSTLIHWMHAISSGGFVFRTLRRNVWAMSHEILGKIEQFRVRVSSVFTGVRREKGEERREKKEKRCKKMKKNRVENLVYKRWTGRILTRSSAPRCGPLDLGPDGSGSI